MSRKHVTIDTVEKYLAAICRHGSQALVKSVKTTLYRQGCKVVVDLATSHKNDSVEDFIKQSLKKVEFWHWPAISDPNFQITRKDGLKVSFFVSF